MQNNQSKFFKLSSAVTLLGLVASCAHETNTRVNKPDLVSQVAVVPSSKPMNDSAERTQEPPSIFAAESAAWKPLNVLAKTTVVPVNLNKEFLSWKPLNLPSQITTDSVVSNDARPSKKPTIVAETVSIESSATPLAEIQIPKFQLKIDQRMESLKYAVYFEYASANLNPTGKAAIEALKNDAKEAESIVVVGHADPSGDTKKNTRLANSRAVSVRAEFAKYGITSQKVITKGAVAFSKPEDRLAFKQNVPAEISAASRRADVDITVKPNVTVKASSADKRFVFISG